MREVLEQLCAGRSLERAAARDLFRQVVEGSVPEPVLAAVLTALKVKGETAGELAGAAEALRSSALPLGDLPFPVADSCGTGGDGTGTVNASTAAALVCAACGVRVAKHGNRSVSSACGSADVLEACGVRVDGDPAFVRRALDEVGIGFLFAPRFHPGVRHAMPVRRALGVRTIFNLLGPLCNPAAPRYQLLGVYDAALCRPVAETLALLGCERALVVHGDGLDEIALHGPTTAVLLDGGRLEAFVLDPSHAGFERAPVEALRGGGAAENGAWLRGILRGEGDPVHQHWVALNAGALLWVTGETANLRDGARRALDTLAQGLAAPLLDRWVALSRSHRETGGES
ncbi:MAG: anthranilate phosphoribosyltransferase [Acidobacteria bacterium]|nr:anthranilate phosphoribosyltransferase [Acidobacteriota bacterium]